MLDIPITILAVLHVIICLLLVLIVLMQRPKQEGLGAAFGGGMTDQMFGAQTTNVLQKATVYLGIFFFLNALVLAILWAKKGEETRGTAEKILQMEVMESKEKDLSPATTPNATEKTPEAIDQSTPTPSDAPAAKSTEKETSKPKSPVEAPATTP